MIQIQLTEALGLYSVILFSLITAIWLYTEVSVRRPQRHLGRQFLWKCVYCGCSYLDEGAVAISQCPRCLSYNETEKKSRRRTSPEESAQSVEAPAGRKNTSRQKRKGQRRRGPRRRR